MPCFSNFTHQQFGSWVLPFGSRTSIENRGHSWRNPPAGLWGRCGSGLCGYTSGILLTCSCWEPYSPQKSGPLYSCNCLIGSTETQSQLVHYFLAAWSLLTCKPISIKWMRNLNLPNRSLSLLRGWQYTTRSDISFATSSLISTFSCCFCCMKKILAEYYWSNDLLALFLRIFFVQLLFYYYFFV